jgi:F-type H+-transporting ATPase subunit delta
MRVHKAAKRYAKALFSLARDEGRLENVYRDLQAIDLWLAESEAFSRFVGDPTIPLAQRNSLLEELLKGKADDLTCRFALFLSEKDRLDELESVVRNFELMYDDLQNVQRVRITSAMPLEDDQAAAIAARFGALLGKEIKSTTDVDPAMLGGFKVRVGDTIHDFSIQAQLEALRQNLINK